MTMEKKIERIANKFPDSHRKYCGSPVEMDRGDYDIYVIFYLLVGAFLHSYFSWGYVDILLVGVLIHLINFVLYGAEPLHHKAARRMMSK